MQKAEVEQSYALRAFYGFGCCTMCSVRRRDGWTQLRILYHFKVIGPFALLATSTMISFGTHAHNAWFIQIDVHSGGDDDCLTSPLKVKWILIKWKLAYRFNDAAIGLQCFAHSGQPNTIVMLFRRPQMETKPQEIRVRLLEIHSSCYMLISNFMLTTRSLTSCNKLHSNARCLHFALYCMYGLAWYTHVHGSHSTLFLD